MFAIYIINYVNNQEPHNYRRFYLNRRNNKNNIFDSIYNKLTKA